MEILSELKRRSQLAHSIAKSEYFSANGQDTPIDSGPQFNAAWSSDNRGNPVQLFGPAENHPNLSALNANHLSAGGTQLLDGFSNDERQWYLAVSPTQDPATSVFVFRLTELRLWQPRDYVPFRTNYCVLTSTGDALNCTNSERLFPARDQLFSAPLQHSTSIEWELDGVQYLSSSWPLFLTTDFKADPVTIVATTNYDHALRSVNSIRRIIIPIGASVAVFVAFLSIRLIRKSLVPLKMLTAAAEQYGNGVTDTQVKLDGNDEFSDLAYAFNGMAEKLSRQLYTLESMAHVDDQIISRTPIDIVISDALPRLAEIADAQVCAILQEDPDSRLDANLSIYNSGKINHVRLSFAEAIRRLNIADSTQSLPLPLENLNPAIAKELAGFGVRYITAIPIDYSNNITGTVLIASDSGDALPPDILQSCSDLVARLAIGIATAEREEELYQRAHYDDLTRLPNRQLLKDRLQQCIRHNELHNTKGALLFLDLDRFKGVNDVYGHSSGDSLLKEAAIRISEVFDSSATVARLGGDEFVVLVPEFKNHQQLQSLAQQLVDSLSRPFNIRGGDHVLGASAGIVVIPDDGRSVEILLRNSDAAMYRAKHSGRGRYEFFSAKLNEESRRKMILERDLRSALNNNQLDLHYQPQFWLNDESVRGAEALLRWNHPTFGYVPPDEFIAIAEQSDLIVEIGQWVLERSCSDLRTLLDDGLHPGIIAVNISARQICDEQLLSQVLSALKSNHINPGYLEVEITESIVAQDKEAALRTLSALRSSGIRIGMDDFGTGYSSLSMLRSLPIDCLKIDRAFVSECDSSEDAASICRAIIKMAHSLGKEVIAEGVETNLHASMLKQSECEIAQGYLYAKPMPVAVFREFVAAQSEHTQRRKTLEVV